MKSFTYLFLGLLCGLCCADQFQAPFKPRSDAVQVQLLSSIVTIGGFVYDGNSNSVTVLTNEVWRSDASGRHFYSLGDFPTSIGQSAAVFYPQPFSSGAVLVYGGLKQTGPATFAPSNDVYGSLNGLVSWSPASQAPWTPRYGHQAVRVVVPNQISYCTVLAGGYDGTGYLNDVWIGLPALGFNQSRSTSAAPWSARYGFSMATFNQETRVIIAGGKASSGYLQDVWMGVLNGTTIINWIQMTSAASFGTRYGLGLLSRNDNLYAVAGIGDNGLPTDSYCSPDGGRNWYTTPLTYNGVQGASYYIVGKEVIIVGGATSFPSNGLQNDIFTNFLVLACGPSM